MLEKVENNVHSIKAVTKIKKHYSTVFFCICILIWILLNKGRPINMTFFVRQLCIMLLLTIAVSIEYVSGILDLAFAAQISASSLLCVYLNSIGYSLLIAFISVFIMNLFVGCIKGILVVWLGIPSVVVTLALQVILVNSCIGITDNMSIVIMRIKEIGQSLPFLLVHVGLMVSAVVVINYFFEKTYYGKYCKILGDNLNLAKENGLNCIGIIIVINMIASIFISVPVILLVLYTGSGSGNLGADYLYKVLVAVFLGEIYQGRNMMYGIIIGAILVVLYSSLLTANGYINTWKIIVEGVIILTTMVISSKNKI